MMGDQTHDLTVLQLYLRDTGRYTSEIDGDYGPLTNNAILQALEDGPDSPLTMQDYLDSGGRLGCNPANVLAFAEVEADGRRVRGRLSKAPVRAAPSSRSSPSTLRRQPTRRSATRIGEWSRTRGSRTLAMRSF
jgi:hypothetical protein